MRSYEHYFLFTNIICIAVEKERETVKNRVENKQIDQSQTRELGSEIESKEQCEGDYWIERVELTTNWFDQIEGERVRNISLTLIRFACDTYSNRQYQ